MAQFLSFSIGNGRPSSSSSLSLPSSLLPPGLQMCSHAAGSGSRPPSNIVFFMREGPSVLLPAAVRLCTCARLQTAGFALILLSSLPFSHLLLHQDVLGPPLLCRPAASRVTRVTCSVLCHCARHPPAGSLAYRPSSGSKFVCPGFTYLVP